MAKFHGTMTSIVPYKQLYWLTAGYGGVELPRSTPLFKVPNVVPSPALQFLIAHFSFLIPLYRPPRPSVSGLSPASNSYLLPPNS